MDVKIRNVKLEDLEDIARIQTDGWKTAYRGIVDDDFLDSLDSKYDNTVEKLKNNYMYNNFVVATDNDKVVGYCRYIFDNSNTPEIKDADCEISALYVSPSLKNKGIGSSLFKYVTNEFKKNNKKCMVLWCFKDNEPSKKFYTKMGGEEVLERPVIKGGKEYQEVCFKYNI